MIRRALVLFLLVACRRTEAPPPDAAARPAAREKSTHDLVNLDADSLRDLRLTTARARRQRASEEIVAYGEVALHEDAASDVVAPVRGIIERLQAPVGATVRKGRLLATLRSPELGQARADVLTAAARVRAAEQNLDRQSRVVSAGLAPKRELERARRDLTVARAQHNAALARVGAFGVGVSIPEVPDAMARIALHAPRAGMVTERPVRPGAAVETGGLIYRVADVSRLWLVAHVYEREAARLRVGGSARVSLPAFPGERFEATVAVLMGIVDTASRTVAVRLTVLDPMRRLRPGMAASATFILPATQLIVSVPAPAVQRVEGAWSVFLPRGKASFERREVARGRELGGEVEILKGLQEGEEVVVEGAFLLATEAGRTHEAGEHH